MKARLLLLLCLFAAGCGGLSGPLTTAAPPSPSPSASGSVAVGHRVPPSYVVYWVSESAFSYSPAWTSQPVHVDT